MGTRVLLAGGESEFLMDTLKLCKARFILVSYYYISHKWRGDISELKDYFKNFEFVLIDSGAFTLFSKPGLTYDMIQDYAYKYAYFLEQVRDSVSAGVELDLYEIPAVGLKSHRIRTDILEKSGVPIVPVYHGDAIPVNKQYRVDWVEFCKNYKYVGIASGMVLKGLSHVTSCVSEAKKHGALVHGFGITRQDYLRQARFYTADSTAWTNGQRFGTTYVFENNKLRIYDNKHKQSARNRHRARWLREGFDLTGLEKDATKPFTELNCHEWARFQEYVYNASNRDYWDNSFEVNSAREGKNIILPTRVQAELDLATGLEDDLFGDVLEEDTMVDGNEGVIEAEVVSGDMDNIYEAPTENLPVTSEPVTINTFDDYFNGKIQPGRKYVFFQRDIKKQWTSTFEEVPGGWLETSTSRHNGEGTVKKKIFKDLAAQKVDQLDLDYNNHLRHHLLRNMIRGKEVTGEESMPIAVSRENPISIADAVGQIVACDDCYLGERCDLFRMGSKCAYSLRVEIQNGGDLVTNLQKVIGLQFERVYKGALIEKKDGGVLDKTVSEEMMRAFSMANQLKGIISPQQDKIVIEATGTKGTGVLSKLFGNGGVNGKQGTED